MRKYIISVSGLVESNGEHLAVAAAIGETATANGYSTIQSDAQPVV